MNAETQQVEDQVVLTCGECDSCYRQSELEPIEIYNGEEYVETYRCVECGNTNWWIESEVGW
jgi:heterodisulfide reductase subunit A-like polyferredoxin